MPQSLAKIIVHIVFSTKHHAPFLTDDVRQELFAYMAGILKELDAAPILINGTEDHVHVLCQLPRNHAPSTIIQKIKSASSRWIKTKSPQLEHFQWQSGYGIFSVSQSHADSVKRYITNQQTHHKTLSFKDEFRRFLDKYKVQYDERYVWD